MSMPILPFRSGAANMTELERVLRLLGGLLGTPLLYLVVARPLHGLWGVAALVGIVVAGVDLVVSGIRGFCPVYRLVAVPWAGAETAGRRSRRSGAGRQSAPEDGHADPTPAETGTGP